MPLLHLAEEQNLALLAACARTTALLSADRPNTNAHGHPRGTVLPDFVAHATCEEVLSSLRRVSGRRRYLRSRPWCWLGAGGWQ